MLFLQSCCIVQEAQPDTCASSCVLVCTLLSVAISALQGDAVHLFATIPWLTSMAVCGKNGSLCYWAHSSRLPGQCNNCMWTPPDGCHPNRMLCAKCFEEKADEAFSADPKWKYPACLATNCREKSRVQAEERDIWMDLVPWYAVSAFSPSLLTPPPGRLPPGLPAASSSANVSSTTSAASAMSFSAEGHSLVETVDALQDAVLTMSLKADAIMDLMEQVKRSISLIPQLKPLCP